MRNPEYQFTDAGIEALEARLVQEYENFSGAAVQPGSPERVIIQWVASILTHERALMNYIGNQNIPSRAEGENLDALAELMYLPKRPQAAAAVCTQRFHISEPQQSAILVPKGTRVTSSGGPIFVFFKRHRLPCVCPGLQQRLGVKAKVPVAHLAGVHIPGSGQARRMPVVHEVHKSLHLLLLRRFKAGIGDGKGFFAVEHRIALVAVQSCLIGLCNSPHSHMDHTAGGRFDGEIVPGSAPTEKQPPALQLGSAHRLGIGAAVPHLLPVQIASISKVVFFHDSTFLSSLL